MNSIEFGDCREIMSRWAGDGVEAHTCVTSPPYWGLRDYGVDGQIGLEGTPGEYITSVVEVFRAVRDVLRDDGTVWLNLGDSYASVGKWGGSSGEKHVKALHGNTGVGRGKRDFGGLKNKDLIGIPWRVALALQNDGWYLRQDIIWNKPNAMPESVQDRCTKAHEYIFLLSKSKKYYYDADAIAEPLQSDPATWGRHSKKDPGAQAPDPKPMFRPGRDGSEWGNGKTRNKRSVWTVPTRAFKGAHFATFPPDLIEPCVLAGCPAGGIVLDPFMGSGTTAMVALSNGRQYLGCELNPEYGVLQDERIASADETKYRQKTLELLSE